ncbi:glycoside hydrolase family 43 protein [Paenibacillus gansuensis]|uniref:Glycoside hydrolase family 43 protein n=1 Tax=Paenibacillus gansuensis TaxID=306542 RepID=A0ABW5P7A0_9BACL
MNRKTSGNPIAEGYYADPESRFFEGKYWIYPTWSAPYEEQRHLDAFSSTNLADWDKTERILDGDVISWFTHALWAPSPIDANGKYYLYFSANDIQNDNELGGIGVAVADRPEGPFRDALGKPLIDRFHNGAQPIDPHVFRDDDGTYYLYYGGWRHCNLVKLGADMTSIVPFEDGSVYKEVTPDGYVEGPCMLKRNGVYYFMWAEGDWGGPGYSVGYSMSDTPFGPFKRLSVILKQDENIATSAGHHSFLQVPGKDEWYITYHRRPLGETNIHHRVLCIDRMHFNPDGTIRPVAMTHSGVERI